MKQILTTPYLPELGPEATHNEAAEHPENNICNCERWRVNENITIEIVKAKEMKPVMTSLGLNVTFLSKKKCKKYSIISINEESEHYNYSEL